MRRPVSGFTLIEALLYIAFVGMIMGSAVSLAYTAFSVRSTVRATAVLQENVRFSVGRVRALIQSANGVTVPVSAATGTVLTLSMPTASENPTTIRVQDGVLIMTQGTGTGMALTSNEMVISSLVFTHVSGTAPLVRMVLTAGVRNATARYPSMTVTSTQSIYR